MQLGRRGDGGIDVSLEVLISLVLAILFLAAIILNIDFLAALLGFGGDQDEQGTINNFNELAQIMKELKEGSFVPGFPLYISQDFIIVSFNRDNEGVSDHCEYEKVPRPSSPKCSKSACICLYREQTGDQDFSTNIPVMCQDVDTDVIMTLDYYSDAPGKGTSKYTQDPKIYKNVIGPKITIESEKYKDEYAQLFIYGQCEDWYVDESIGIQRLYIEKVAEGGKTYIFAADGKSGERYQQRLEQKEQVPQA